MTDGFPSTSDQRARGKQQCSYDQASLTPIPSFLQCPIGYTGQPCPVQEETKQEHAHQEVRTVGGHLEVATARRNNNYYSLCIFESSFAITTIF